MTFLPIDPFTEFLQVVARLTRELCCEWLLSNLPSSAFSPNWMETKLSQEELRNRLFSLFSLVLEMIVASEFAREDLHPIFVVKHSLV